MENDKRSTVISKSTVDALIAKGVPGVVRDAKLAGFQARLNRDGTVSYLLEYRAGRGRAFPIRRVVIGKHGVDGMTADKARRDAEDMRAKARDERAPIEERDVLARRKREAAITKADAEALTVLELAEKWLLDEVEGKRKPATVSLYKIHVNKHIAGSRIAKTKAKDLTGAEVEKFHRKLGETKPTTANRVLASLSGIYTWAARPGRPLKGIANPVIDIRHFAETARERFLSGEELARLGATLREAETVGLPWRLRDGEQVKTKHRPKADENLREVLSIHVTAAVRLLLFTGCRLREILHLRWADVDLEKGVITLRDTKTGERKIHISAPSAEVLANLPRLGKYVIAGATAGQKNEKPRADLQRPWTAITAAAELAGLRIHDLRHTHASIGVGSGHGLPIIGRLLGHRNPETTAKYAHFADDPVKRAAETIGSEIEARLRGASAEIIPMKRGA